MTGPKEGENAVTEPKYGVRTQPPGHFLTPDLQSDTARFLAELREAIRRRKAAPGGPSLR